MAVHDRDPVRDDVHFGAVHSVGAFQEVPGDLTHHNELHALGGQRPHDGSLSRGWMLEHGMQRRDSGYAQSLNEIENVDAVVTPENAVLVLNRDHAHVAVV